MAPPTVKSKPAANSACTDLSPVDLSIFQQLPKLSELPAPNQADPEVKSLYQQLITLYQVDLQYGNQDGKLEAKEIDQFLKLNPQGPQVNSCAVLNQARQFAAAVPQLKSKLSQVKDLSPVDLAPFYSLPELKKFLDLPEAIDLEQIKQKIKDADFSPELRKLLLEDKSGILERYINAKYYLRADADHDGKLSLKDLQTLIQNQKIPTDGGFDPALLLSEARDLAPQTALLGFSIRRQYGLKSQEDQIDAFGIFSLAQIAPALINGDPRLQALLDILAGKNEKGELTPRAVAMDGILTREEFSKNPVSAEVKNKLGVSTDEALFAKLKEVEVLLQNPPYLWPKELREKFLKLGVSERQAIGEGYPLNVDQRRSEMVVQWLEVTSHTKEDQEKLDHSGPSGNSWLMKLVGKVVYGQTWNDHFQKERPRENRDARDAAIDLLRKTIRERRLSKIEDAVAFMESNGQGEAVKVLREKCDLNRWVRIANAGKEKSDAIDAFQRALAQNPNTPHDQILKKMEQDGQGAHTKLLREECGFNPKTGQLKIDQFQLKTDRERYLGLQQSAKDYRVGHNTLNWDNLWDFSVVPLPKLGSGGFFERASHASNWVWTTSPEPLMTMAIDNFLAMKTPNNGELTYKPGTFFLLQQLSEEDRKSFDEAQKKAEKGDTIDSKAIDAILEKSPLSSVGKDVLRKHLQNSILSGENLKVVNEFSKKDFVKKWIEEKNQEKLTQIDMFFSLLASGENPEGEQVNLQKLEGNLHQLGLGEDDLKSLKKSLEKIQTLAKFEEGNGVDVLFREANLKDKQSRAIALWDKSIRTDAEEEEFYQLVKSSSLSEDNKLIFQNAFDLQPITEEIANPAQEEFLSITGHPHMLDAEKNIADPRYAGNLHRSMSVTAQKGVGVGMIAAPSLVGGGVGLSLAKASPLKAGLGGAAAGGLIGYALSDHNDHGATARNTALGAVGGGLFSGLFSYTFKTLKGGKLSPWWGAIALGATSNFVYATEGGKQWGSMAVDTMSTPYRPWSDFAMADMPYESLNLYFDFYAGSKAMEGIFGGAQVLGELKPIQRLLKSPVASTLAPVSMGGLMGYQMTPENAKADEKIKNTLLGAGVGLGLRYSLKKGLPGIVASGATGGYFGYTLADNEKGDLPKKLKFALIGAGVAIGGSRILARGTDALKANVIETEAAKEGWTNSWARRQYELIVGTETRSGRLARMKAQSSVDPKEVEQLEELAEAYKKLGMAKENQMVATQYLTAAKKMSLEGKKLRAASGDALLQGRNLEEQSEKMILAASKEFDVLNKTSTSNKKLSRLLLVGVVANKVDAKVNPLKPLVPPFETDFVGDPRPVPQSNSTNSGGQNF